MGQCVERVGDVSVSGSDVGNAIDLVLDFTLIAVLCQGKPNGGASAVVREDSHTHGVYTDAQIGGDELLDETLHHVPVRLRLRNVEGEGDVHDIAF